MSDFESKELFPQTPEAQTAQLEQERRIGLVHVLRPEFHGLNPDDFNDISEEVVERASASELQSSLLWEYIKVGDRDRSEESPTAIAYRTPHQGFMSVALTPEEYDAMSTSIEKLANRAFTKVLVSRDQKLQEASGDPMARARSEEDIRVANRGALRPVLKSRDEMQRLLETGILPKIELISRFSEMTQGRNPNLARGTRESVSARFDELRGTIFDDMLDVIGLQRQWTPDMTKRAKRIIQKRLYISGSGAQRVRNFKEMLALADHYYGHKRALVQTRIYEADKYIYEREDILADIISVDDERQQAKTAKQLSLDEDE